MQRGLEILYPVGTFLWRTICITLFASQCAHHRPDTNQSPQCQPSSVEPTGVNRVTRAGAWPLHITAAQKQNVSLRHSVATITYCSVMKIRQKQQGKGGCKATAGRRLDGRVLSVYLLGLQLDGRSGAVAGTVAAHSTLPAQAANQSHKHVNTRARRRFDLA